jgi:hypothetical protein
VILPWIDERREATPAAQEVITIANIQNFNRRFWAVEFRKRVLSWSLDSLFVSAGNNKWIRPTSPLATLETQPIS